MATDINAAKSTTSLDNNLSSAKTTVQNNISEIDFGDIIRKSSSRLNNGLNLLSDRAGITGVSERIDNAPVDDQYTFDENYKSNDDARSQAHTDDNTDYNQARGISDNVDYNSDFDDNDTQIYKPEVQEFSNDQRPDNKKFAENQQQDDHANYDGETSGHEDSTDRSLKQLRTDEINSTSNSEAIGNSSNKETLSNLINVPQVNILPGHSSSRSTKKDSNILGHAAEQANPNGQKKSEGKNTVPELNMTAQNSSRKTDSNSTKIGQSSTNSQNTLAQAISSNLPNTPGQALNQNVNNADLLATTGAKESASNKTLEQAAQLSKMVGNGKKLDISVSVMDEKSTLVSKPTANLSSNTILAADTSATSLRSQQGQGTGKASATGQSQQASEQVASATAQLQQAVGTQTQPSNTASASIKATANQGLSNIGTLVNPSTNGEVPIPTSPNNINAAQQAQHNTSMQAANSTRFTTANHALVEQVSVQISKALNAGNDRISIQLKPADLGRVDIQMELGQDGRVTAIVTADNKQTLDLLQKDSKQLQEALQQAGLQTDEDSLSFNLREQDDDRDLVDSEGSSDEGSENELTLDEELAGIKPNIITDTRVDVQA